HNLIPEEADYEEIRNFFMDHLPEDVQLFNEYHALLVALGKNYCRSKPLCENCPLKGI
ncbi:MAG: endonuclease III domain-containing protein, partial [Candidatus Desulfofervidaceae bacterium]|nr:endonuclease III domain-containing protein [Candidatus Desulfofervidaceae bacterium]